MTGGVLVLGDGARPAASEGSAALALQLAREGGLDAHLAYWGAQDWPDYGWHSARRIAADDGRLLAGALASLIEDGGFRAVVAPDTPSSREAIGRAAGRLGLALAARALSVTFDGEGIDVVRSVEEGRRSATYRLLASPALVLADADAPAPALPPARGRVTGETTVVEGPESFRLCEERTLRPYEIAPNEADVVVAGGRGLGKEGFRLAEELAALMQGAVGASRVAVDLGWAPKSCQIGMTGQTVQPRLYIAAGISGAIHHTFGMKESGFIVAINSDPRAPILQFADAAIVADAAEVLAALTEQLKARRRSGVDSGKALAGTRA
jgi:electron transfer flavoprotein alpha subunit